MRRGCYDESPVTCGSTAVETYSNLAALFVSYLEVQWDRCARAELWLCVQRPSPSSR